MVYLFEPPPPASLPILGTADLFPVHRVYCVGRNYAAHAREMGADPEREPPVFFMKPADAIAHDGAAIPYPPATADLHYEVELVAALGEGGTAVLPERALDLVFGYAVGIEKLIQVCVGHVGKMDVTPSCRQATLLNAIE